MVTRTAIYEGDGLIHSRLVEAQQGKGGADASAAPPEVSKRRASALRNFFPKLAIWLNDRVHFSRMREVERYLAQATDLADLEHRIAQIERGERWH